MAFSLDTGVHSFYMRSYYYLRQEADLVVDESGNKTWANPAHCPFCTFKYWQLQRENRLGHGSKMEQEVSKWLYTVVKPLLWFLTVPHQLDRTLGRRANSWYPKQERGSAYCCKAACDACILYSVCGCIIWGLGWRRQVCNVWRVSDYYLVGKWYILLWLH